MKNLKLALIATAVACAIMNLSYADGFNANSNKCLSIDFSKAVQDPALVVENTLIDCLIFKNEDPSVDNIPFTTEKIFNDTRMKELTAKWQEENNVDDVPFNIRHQSLCQQMIMKVMPEYLNMFAVNADHLIYFCVVLIVRLFFSISNSLLMASLFLMSLIFRVLAQYLM